MAIIIKQDIPKIAMKDGIDIRSFKEGEIHILAPWNEQHLIALGLADVAIPADAETAKAVEDAEAQVAAETPAEPADASKAAPVAETIAETPSEAPTAAAEPVEADAKAEEAATAE